MSGGQGPRRRVLDNLVEGKKSSEDRDWSGFSITQPRTGIVTGFVLQYGLGSCLCPSS